VRRRCVARNEEGDIHGEESQLSARSRADRYCCGVGRRNRRRHRPCVGLQLACARLPSTRITTSRNRVQRHQLSSVVARRHRGRRRALELLGWSSNVHDRWIQLVDKRRTSHVREPRRHGCTGRYCPVLRIEPLHIRPELPLEPGFQVSRVTRRLLRVQTPQCHGHPRVRSLISDEPQSSRRL
jgi:hypothetical protein